MERIIITPSSEQEYALVVELLKKMRIRAAPYRAEAPTRMTEAEYRAMVDYSLACADRGMVVEHDEMKRQIAQWR